MIDEYDYFFELEYAKIEPFFLDLIAKLYFQKFKPTNLVLSHKRKEEKKYIKEYIEQAVKENLKILGLSETEDSWANVQNAHRGLAKKYHPDLNPGKNTHEEFIKIQGAYEFLENDRKKIFLLNRLLRR